jgi:4'-phosphopantetheinyl transferase
MPTVHSNWIDKMVWNNFSNNSFKPGEDVDIWHINIPSFINHISKFKILLNDDEMDRAQRYRQEKDRNRFLIARGTLRIILSKYLRLPSNAIQIAIGKNKKPFVHSSDAISLHYNTTHSGDLILIAISRTALGIDIEKINSDFAYADILQSNFTDNEIRFMNSGKNQPNHFYTLWTRKEALVKATGKGMDDEFRNVPSLDGSHWIEEHVIGSTENWQVESFRLGDEYIGAIAHSRAVHVLRFWNTDPSILYA